MPHAFPWYADERRHCLPELVWMMLSKLLQQPKVLDRLPLPGERRRALRIHRPTSTLAHCKPSLLVVISERQFRPAVVEDRRQSTPVADLPVLIVTIDVADHRVENEHAVEGQQYADWFENPADLFVRVMCSH